MIACISLPYFAAGVERRNNDNLAEKPLTIGGQPWEARPVYAFSREVAQQGARIGMSLRLVQVLSPHSCFLPAAETRYSHVSGEIVDNLLDFSLLIEPQELWHPHKDKRPLTLDMATLPARYCLDLEGLPQVEAVSYVKEIGRTLRKKTMFSPAIGLAAQKFTAEVAATICRPDFTLPVKPGTDGQFLASRSLKFLPIERDIARRLRLLGVYSLGQLANLPLPALRDQFGPTLVPFYQQARGEGQERLRAIPQERVEKAELSFDGPVADVGSLAAAAEQLVLQLANQLHTKGLVGRRLSVTLDREDGETQQESQVLSRPTSKAGRLLAVVREMLAREAYDCSLIRLEVIIDDIQPARGRQLTLLDAASRMPHQTSLGPHALESLANLIVKYRKSSFFQPRLADVAHPLPERRFTLQPLSHDALVA